MTKKPVTLKRRADSGPVYLTALVDLEFSAATHPEMSDDLRYVNAGEVYDARHLRPHFIDNVMVRGGHVERYTGELADLTPQQARWLIANGDVVLPSKTAPKAKEA